MRNQCCGDLMAEKSIKLMFCHSNADFSFVTYLTEGNGAVPVPLDSEGSNSSVMKTVSFTDRQEMFNIS